LAVQTTPGATSRREFSPDKKNQVAPSNGGKTEASIPG